MKRRLAQSIFLFWLVGWFWLVLLCVNSLQGIALVAPDRVWSLSALLAGWLARLATDLVIFGNFKVTLNSGGQLVSTVDPADIFS